MFEAVRGQPAFARARHCSGRMLLGGSSPMPRDGRQEEATGRVASEEQAPLVLAQSGVDGEQTQIDVGVEQEA